MQIIITDVQWLLLLLLVLAFALLASVILAKPILRYFINRVNDDTLSKLLTDKYEQNLAELFPSLQRFSVLNLIELSLRAETGKAIGRPLGSPKQFLGYDNLLFTPKQMTKFSLPENVKVDMSVTLGPKAAKPLTFPFPLMIGGMAFGLALSEE